MIDFDCTHLTGVGVIDGHNKHLVDLFNSFLVAFKARKHKSEIGKMLDELVDYATYHFSAEEQWMKEYKFPGLEEHCKDHAEFISRVAAMQKDYVAGRTTISLEILAFMMNWLTTHTFVTDVTFGQFVSKRNRLRAA